MNNTDYQTVDEYLAAIPEAERKELERIRTLVKTFVPEATESISYKMPAFKYKGRPLLYYAAFKNHLSLFPTNGPTEALTELLADYETSKGTIKFTLQRTLSDDITKEILIWRMDEINQKG